MAARILRGGEGVTKALADISKRMGGGEVRVGFPEGATHPSAQGSIPTAAIMFWAEYGHGGPFPSPPRPYFRTMIAKESPTWAAKMGAAAKATDYDGPAVLRMMGEDVAGALRDSIRTFADVSLSDTTLVLRARFGNSPERIKFSDVLEAQQDARKPETEKASGFQAKPLIWTGLAIKQVSYEVKMT